MRSGEGNILFLKPRLEIFLNALLRVKARAVETGMLSGAKFALNDLKVALGFGHPLSRQSLHRAAFPSDRLHGGKNRSRQAGAELLRASSPARQARTARELPGESQIPSAAWSLCR